MTLLLFFSAILSVLSTAGAREDVPWIARSAVQIIPARPTISATSTITAHPEAVGRAIREQVVSPIIVAFEIAESEPRWANRRRE